MGHTSFPEFFDEDGQVAQNTVRAAKGELEKKREKRLVFVRWHIPLVNNGVVVSYLITEFFFS